MCRKDFWGAVGGVLCLMRAGDMPLLGCSDAPSVPVLRFGLSPCGFLCSEVTGGAICQLAVQLDTGFFHGYVV